MIFFAFTDPIQSQAKPLVVIFRIAAGILRGTSIPPHRYDAVHLWY